MGKIAFVFSGQGAQYPGMGQTLYDNSNAAKSAFDAFDGIRKGTSEQCFGGSADELKLTANTQPCIFAVELAAASALNEAGIFADAVAGFSLGEVAALTYAKAFSLQDGFSAVCKRGEYMAEASEKHCGSMAAILKLSNEKVEELCSHYDCLYPVNYNCAGQVTVSGDPEQLKAYMAEAKESGGRCVPLKVSGSFHSPLMAEASDKFYELLKDTDMAKPSIPVYANRTAEPYGGDIKKLLADQIKNPVRWQTTVENMIKDGVDTFIEVGPGNVLAGLIKKISKDVTVYNAETFEQITETVKAVKENA